MLQFGVKFDDRIYRFQSSSNKLPYEFIGACDYLVNLETKEVIKDKCVQVNPDLFYYCELMYFWEVLDREPRLSDIDLTYSFIEDK